MTLDEAIEEARRRPGHDTLAVWVRNTLGEDQPCVFEPEIIRLAVAVGSGRHVRLNAPLIANPTELRALCAAWLRACDEADR